MLTWDYKTKLQEYCQSEKNSLSYSLVASENINNCEKQFTIEVRDSFGKFAARGQGRTKKKAEQEAAYGAMKKLQLLGESD